MAATEPRLVLSKANATVLAFLHHPAMPLPVNINPKEELAKLTRSLKRKRTALDELVRENVGYAAMSDTHLSDSSAAYSSKTILRTLRKSASTRLDPLVNCIGLPAIKVLPCLSFDLY